ncbi:hypothetical protein ACWGH5_37575 [Streptomyces sp. NPDC054864]
MINVTTASFYETVSAEGVPALMELLARWTPVVQGAASAAWRESLTTRA